MDNWGQGTFTLSVSRLYRHAVRQPRETIIVTLRPAVFDRHVAALDVAGLGESSAKRVDQVRIRAGRSAVEEPHHRHRLRLRARRKWPGNSRATEKHDELAPFHSITSSAVASNIGGTSRPSALAVLRLMTSSNLVGCTTGRSAGLAPLRIF